MMESIDKHIFRLEIPNLFLDTFWLKSIVIVCNVFNAHFKKIEVLMAL